MTTSTLTTEEIYALPEDGFERDLIRGELRVYPSSFRTRRNAETLAAICQVLGSWARTNEVLNGEVAASNVGVRLKRDPETLVGLDATFFTAESIARMPPDQAWYDGVPVLAVKLLSPSDTHGELVERINLYLECGVQVVWVLDPDFETFTVYRAGAARLMLRTHETLNGHPELPGLNVPVRAFFN